MYVRKRPVEAICPIGTPVGYAVALGGCPCCRLLHSNAALFLFRFFVEIAQKYDDKSSHFTGR